MLKLYELKTSYYLDAIIAVLVLFLIIVMFMPKYLWSEEDRLREESRIRMENLYQLEIEFYRLVNRFPKSPEEAMKVVTAALELSEDDTNFFGVETLKVDTTEYIIDTQGDLGARVDTLMTLPISESLFECPLVQERYIITIKNNRTIRIECPIKQELNPIKILIIEPDDSLRNLYAEIMGEDNYEIRTQKKLAEALSLQREWKPELVVIDDSVITDESIKIVNSIYKNDKDVLVLLMMVLEPDTITENRRRLLEVNGIVPYSFAPSDLKDKVDQLVLQTPRRWLREDYYERKYLFFTMGDSTHGYIEDGEKSWKKRKR